MIGRLADLFRLAWGLLYWNVRKSWFQLHRGRAPCPCQNASDSGRALETGCEPCVNWAKPARFRRVCPLLVDTPDGLRCSVDTSQVRPFWGRAAAFYAGAGLILYLAAALAVFAFLRTVGYPIRITHLVWPPSWHRVGEVRGWFFVERAQRAFAAGRQSEGMLYLTNAYEFDPSNYAVAFALAQKLQLTHPVRADEIYREMARNHPAEHARTYQVWFRALLARGDFAAIEEIARLRLFEDLPNASVWMRALVFATRQTGEDRTLQQLLASNEPAILPWHPLLQTELLLRRGQHAEARAHLGQRWPVAPPFSIYYQVDELTNLGDPIAAVDLLEANRAQLDDTARVRLLLHAYATLRTSQSMQRLITALLDPPLQPATVNLLAAHLIRHPDSAVLDQLFTRFLQARFTLNNETLETYLGLYCAVAAAGNWAHLQTLNERIQQDLGGHVLALGAAESFFRGQTTRSRISALLPALPMTLELHYVLLERYPGARASLASTP